MAAAEGTVIACHTKDEFDAQLAKANEAGKLVVIDFMIPRCGPCEELAPVIAKCAKEYPAAVFLKVDANELKEVADRYHIEGVPTVIFIRDGLTMEGDIIIGPDNLRNAIKEFVKGATPAASASSA